MGGKSWEWSPFITGKKVRTSVLLNKGLNSANNHASLKDDPGLQSGTQSCQHLWKLMKP